MKKLISILLSAAAALSLTACGVSYQIAPSATPSDGAPDAEEPVATAAPYTDPYSGEGCGRDLSLLRPWAVMINNLEQALPQKGVSQAEILYEIPAEGGVTRMMAIFSDVSQVGDIGSMRSIRPYYAEVALSYDAIAVHAGGSEAAYDVMSGHGMDNLDGVLGGGYAELAFFRDPERMKNGYEHSMFATGEGLIAAAEKQGYPLEHSGGARGTGLEFSLSAAEQCVDKAEYVRINYNGWKWTSFVYLPEEGVYEAYEYGERYVDADNDRQLTFANVLVLETDVSVIDDVGRLSVATTGSGDGVFVCGGRSVPIRWSRADAQSPFTYSLADGTPLELGVGHSFIGIIGKSGTSVEYEKK